jgi:hypothetical protein
MCYALEAVNRVWTLKQRKNLVVDSRTAELCRRIEKRRYDAGSSYLSQIPAVYQNLSTVSV